MEHYVAMGDEPLVAYKACLAEALHCLLTAELGEEEGDSGELLASTLWQHLRKQLAFTEYVQLQTSARLVSVDIRDNDESATSSPTTKNTSVDEDDDDDLNRRRLLMECFQGVNLYYSSPTQQHCPLPQSSPPHSHVGPSL